MSDVELVTLLREYPEQGCRALLSQYTGLVLAVCRQKLGGICTEEDLEELASDVLFSFWQDREEIDLQRGSIRALLTTITSRRCVDQYRKRGSKPPAGELPDETLTDPAGTPEQYILTAEKRTALLDAVRALGEPDAEIVIRKYYRDETAAEIADRLEMRTSAVEMRLTRARRKLKAMLGGEGYEH